MMSEIALDDIVGNPVHWKTHYKKQVKAVHAEFCKESTWDWRIVGDPQGRIKIYAADNGTRYKAQGEVYCRARQLATLWKDLDFARRVSAWGDLLDGASCETVAETYHSETVGPMAVSKLKTLGYRLHWSREDVANQSWTVLSAACAYRNCPKSSGSDSWMAIYILQLDPHPQYGARCYLRLVSSGQPTAVNDRLLEQIANCERFCRDTDRYEATYSESALRARDLAIRMDCVPVALKK